MKSKQIIAALIVFPLLAGCSWFGQENVVGTGENVTQDTSAKVKKSPSEIMKEYGLTIDDLPKGATIDEDGYILDQNGLVLYGLMEKLGMKIPGRNEDGSIGNEQAMQEYLRSGAPVVFQIYGQDENQTLRLGDSKEVKLLISSKEAIVTLVADLTVSSTLKIKSVTIDEDNFPNAPDSKLDKEGASANISAKNLQGIQGMNFRVATIEIEAIAEGEAKISFGDQTEVRGKDEINITPAQSPTLRFRVEGEG